MNPYPLLAFLFFVILLVTLMQDTPSQQTRPRVVQPIITGTASWYGEELRGEPMANGHPFDPEGFTAASWDFLLGTWVKVRTPTRSVEVQITDRGPARRYVAEGRVIDLSRRAFSCLAPTKQGLVDVTVSPLK